MPTFFLFWNQKHKILFSFKHDRVLTTHRCGAFLLLAEQQQCPVTPPGKLGETIKLSLILPHWHHYVKTPRHSQNQKYITHCNAVRGRTSHSDRRHVQVISWSLDMVFEISEQTDRHTLIAILCTTTVRWSNYVSDVNKNTRDHSTAQHALKTIC